MVFTTDHLVGALAGGLTVLLIALVVYRRKTRFGFGSAPKKELHLASHREFEKNLQLVIQDLAQLCREQPSLTQPYLILGNLYRIAGETQRSIVIHQNLLTDQGLSKATRDRVSVELANDLVELNMEEQAVRTLQEISDRSPLFAMAQERLIELFYKQGQFEKAYDCAMRLFGRDKAWRHRKRAAYFQALLGEKLLQDGELPAARKAADTALDQDAECLLALLVRGGVELEEHAYDKAIENFMQLLQINPNFAFVSLPKIEDAFYRAQSFMRLGEALRSLSQNLPTNGYLSYTLGKYFRKRKMYEESRRELRHALEQNGTNIPAQEEMLNLNVEENRAEESLSDYAELIEEIKTVKRFICNYCQTRYEKMAWHCPSCGRWESILADVNLVPNKHGDDAQETNHPAVHHQASHS